ncbi:MAG: universal stress protein [Bacteroidota bacterium]
MKKLLFLTDFSENAKRAIYYGLRLFSSVPCEINIIHSTYQPYTVANTPASPVDVRTEVEREKMEELETAIDNDFPKHQFNIKTEIMYGDILGTTDHLVKTEGIELIVMGTHGVSGFAEAFIGSNTTAVIREIDCAVLAVPENCEFVAPKKIILAIDKDETLMELVFRPLIDLAEYHQSEMIVLHVAKSMDEAEAKSYENLERYLANVPHRLITIYDEDISEGVDGFSKAYQADILGIVNQKLGFFQGIFHQSLSRKLALRTTIPLMIMSNQK